MSMVNELITLMNDSLTNKVGLFNENASKYTDQAIREAFFEILGDDKLTYQNWRAHKNECFSIIESVLNTNLPLAWENSAFYDNFVEIRQGQLGDANEFVVEDASSLIVSRISGNHWDIERQKLQGKKSFGLALEWVGIRVYAELESFLKGNITLAEMVAKLQKAFQNEIDARVFAAFNASSMRSFFSFISTSVGAPTLITATPPDIFPNLSLNCLMSYSYFASFIWDLMILARSAISSGLPCFPKI